jgi:hypothetical protein
LDASGIAVVAADKETVTKGDRFLRVEGRVLPWLAVGNAIRTQGLPTVYLRAPPTAKLCPSELFDVAVYHTGKCGNDEVSPGWGIGFRDIAHDRDVQHGSVAMTIEHDVRAGDG